MTVTVLTGDCLALMRGMAAESVHCAVTSPPYFGLRDYGHAGQIGLEETPDTYVARLVEVFREVRRVLRDDGTCWVNLGDSYASSTKGGGGDGTKSGLMRDGRSEHGRRSKIEAVERQHHAGVRITCDVPAKNLLGIPWRVAFALQADGWWLRQDIIWHKPNPMPESVTDRCTKAHEYLFLLSKGPRYYFDAWSINEPVSLNSDFGRGRPVRPMPSSAGDEQNDGRTKARLGNGSVGNGSTRNRRSVWTVASQPFAGAHFATFPPALIEPCILAGAPAQCCAACGAPWERQTRRTDPTVSVTGPKNRGLVEQGLLSDGKRRASFHGAGWRNEAPDITITTGFARTCACDAAPVPGVVLDPFGGAGTTGLVAAKRQRSAILCELNPAYAEMARDRIAREAGLFAWTEAAE